MRAGEGVGECGLMHYALVLIIDNMCDLNENDI